MTPLALTCALRTAQVLKSLVFSAAGEPVLVVVLGEGRVDARKLATLLGVRRADVRLATPAAAEAATGYAIGTIPPLGHARRLRTVLDAAVLAGGPACVLYGGGGGGAAQLEIAAGELLRAAAAEVADVLQGRAPPAAAALEASAAGAFSDAGAEELLGAYAGGAFAAAAPAAWPPRGDAALDQRVAPTRPLRADVAAVLGAAPATFAAAGATLPARVELEATVSRARRMGRLLLFATLTEPRWEAGSDAALFPGALQAIAGRTLAAVMGEEATAALLRSLRPGLRVRIAGRPQANPREGCLDVVVAELTCLESPQPLAAPAAADRAGEPFAGDDRIDDRSGADAKDPDAWLFAEDDDDGAGGGGAAFQDGDDEELLQYTNACGDAEESDADDAGVPAAGVAAWRLPASSSSRRRSSPRRSSFAAVLGPLRAFALRPEASVTLVQSAADVDAMGAAVLDPTSAAHEPLPLSADAGAPAPAPLPAAVGIDAEWRPYARGADATPVALLQLATRRAVFLVDTLALSAAPGGLSALDAFLRQLLPSERILKLGFGLSYDLARLYESYGELTPPGTGQGGAASRLRALLELRGAAFAAAPDALPWLPHPRRLAGVGLASLARLVLRAELDKAQQTSDWAARPLSPAQAAYAAADAAVLCALFDALMQRSPRLRARLPFLLNAPPARAFAGAAATSTSRPARGGAGGAGRGAPPRGDKVALDALRVSVPHLLEHFLGVPLPGKGRDAALAAAAGGGADGARPRGAGGCRGGVLECANAALLFMNAEPVAGKRYPNEFWRRPRDGALMVSWFGGPGQHERTPQVARLMGAEELVLLFVRMPRGPYVFCGRLACEGTGDSDDAGGAAGGAAGAGGAVPARGLLRLRMRLLDAEPLCGSAHFASLVAHAQGDAGLALLRRR